MVKKDTEDILAKSKKNQIWLDQNQYTRNGILRYEKIFGQTYIGPGGEDSTDRFTSKLNLEHGQKVLDIGCGIGGAAFFMANKYSVNVYGMDLSSNMISIANEYRSKMSAAVQHRVQFHVEDATLMEYPENFYDVIYSRDTILHIDDKLSLFKKIMKSLKPGGKLMISDYCHGDKEHSASFKKYVAGRGYALQTVTQYGDILKKAGLKKVVASDISDYMIEILKKELNEFCEMRSSFIREFSKEDFDYIYRGWREKLDRVQQGDQVWGFFTAQK